MKIKKNGKLFTLTESDLKKITKKVINEINDDLSLPSINKTKKMTAKEWFESSKYLYDLGEHDESGYLGTNEEKVAEMLEEYHKYKLEEVINDSDLTIPRRNYMRKHDRGL